MPGSSEIWTASDSTEVRLGWWAGWPRQAAAASSSDIGGALLSNRRKSKQGQQGQTYTELEQQCLTSGRHTLPASERERAIQLLSPAIEATEAKRIKSAGNESNIFENVNRCKQMECGLWHVCGSASSLVRWKPWLSSTKYSKQQAASNISVWHCVALINGWCQERFLGFVWWAQLSYREHKFLQPAGLEKGVQVLVKDAKSFMWMYGLRHCVYKQNQVLDRDDVPEIQVPVWFK